MLESEFEFYPVHQKKFIEKYEGRYIVIKNKKIIGNYTSMIDAYKETKLHHELGSFLIQLCEKESNPFSNTFHTQLVSF